MAKLIERPKPVSAPEQGQFGQAMQWAIEKQGFTIQEVANEIQVSYEHVRRLIRTLAFPSKSRLERICQMLSLNEDEMKKLLLSDRLKHKYGNIPQSLYGQDPDPKLERINRNLLKLSDEQFNMIARMVESAAKNGGPGNA